MALRSWPDWTRPDPPKQPARTPLWLREGEQERLLDLYRQVLGEIRHPLKRKRDVA